MIPRTLAFGFLVATFPAFAAHVSCPDLSTATRTGTCPGEEELQFTFNGYCSDDARVYGKGAEVCTDYQAYRRMKNVALWESADGRFQAYVSCDLPEARLKAMRPKGISTSRDKGGMDRLVCTYDEGVAFTRRDRETCRIVSAAACSHRPEACAADCAR